MRQGERLRWRLAAALATIALAVGTAAATPGDARRGFFAALVDEVRGALERASLDLTPKPPVAVAHQWRTANRGTFETGAPVLALEAVDLDGKSGDELVVLTTAEVLVFATSPSPRLLSRAALPGGAAVVRSRDPVGTISVERGARMLVAVRTSEQANGARYAILGESLVIVEELDAGAGFPLCPGISADLELGRNEFDPATLKIADGRWPAELARPTKPFYRLICRDVIGGDGRTNRMVALTGPEREVAVGCMRGAAACADDAVSRAPITGAGVAFDVADLNRDGRAEIVTTLGKAPGDQDFVRVGDSGGKQLKTKKFGIGVIGVAAVDVAGDGRRHLYFALRQADERQMNLWTLNRHP